MNLFDLYAKIGIDDSEYNKGIDAADTKGKTFAERLGAGLGGGVTALAKGAAVAVGVAGGAIGALGKLGLDYNTQMETYTTNFQVMLGSQEEAAAKVNELKEFAASTPLSMADLADGTKTLLAFGVSNEETTGKLRQLGDIALGDAEKMKSLANAYGKAAAQGKLTGDTVQMMVDAGFNPLMEISRQTGESMEDLQKRMSAGQVSVEELDGALAAVTSGTGQFAGGMEQASHTTAGMMSTLKDNAQALVGEVFMPISEGLLSQVLPSCIEAVDTLTTAYQEQGVGGMISAAGEIIGKAVGEFTTNLPKFVEVAVSIVKSLLEGLIDNSGTIVDGAIKTVDALLGGFIELLPKIIELGMTLIVKIALGLIKAIPQLVAKIPEIIVAIVEGFAAAFGDFMAIGDNIVKGIWQGISNDYEWIKAKLSEWVGNVVSFCKKILGIASPSKVFAQIGSYMAQGIGAGFEDSLSEVKKGLGADLNALSDVSLPTITQKVERESLLNECLGAVGNMLSLTGGEAGRLSVQLVMPDGQILAENIFDNLLNEGRRRGVSLG